MANYRRTAIIVLAGACLTAWGAASASAGSPSADKRNVGGKDRPTVVSHVPTPKPASIQTTPEGSRQDVYCATCRLQEGTKDSIPQFGAKQGSLQYARYELTVGPQHQPGELDGITIRCMKAAEDFDSLCHDTQQDPHQNRSNILVFVHGFNVTHDASIRRAAQIATELDHDGLVFVFSWPSLGELSEKAYYIDRQTVNESIAAFRQYLLAIDHEFAGSNIQILAHSLGCRLTGQTVVSIVQAETETAGFRLANVVLAAPDVDAQYFEKMVAPALITVTSRVTVYHSRRDIALAFSKTYNGGQSRLGSIGSTRSDIETIDYSALGGIFLAHGFYCKHPVMVKDLHGVLGNTIPPSQRIFLPIRVVKRETR